MLEYGFAGYRMVKPVNMGDALGMAVPVRLGGSDSVSAVCGGSVSLLMARGEEKALSLEAALVPSVNAPVAKGDVLGEIRVLRDGEVAAAVPAVAGESVTLPGFLHGLLRIRGRFMFCER